MPDPARSPASAAVGFALVARGRGGPIMNNDTTTTTAPDVHPADRLYRVNDDPDTDTTLGAMIEANRGAPLPPHDMARLRALATGERLDIAIPHGPRLTFERRA